MLTFYGTEIELFVEQVLARDHGPSLCCARDWTASQWVIVRVDEDRDHLAWLCAPVSAQTMQAARERSCRSEVRAPTQCYWHRRAGGCRPRHGPPRQTAEVCGYPRGTAPPRRPPRTVGCVAPQKALARVRRARTAGARDQASGGASMRACTGPAPRQSPSRGGWRHR